MNKLKSIRIQNLRSLTDTGEIELKPLTILVGKNSAGKSTFARAFPLLRQSCEAQKKSPFLWYGRFVDFGDFETAINNSDDTNEMKFEFNFSIKSTELINKSISRDFLLSMMLNKDNRINNKKRNQKKEGDINAKISLEISKQLERSTNKFKIDILIGANSYSFLFYIDKSDFTVIANDKTHIIDLKSQYIWKQQEFFPNLVLNKEKLILDYFKWMHLGRQLLPLVFKSIYKREIKDEDLEKITEIESNIFFESDGFNSKNDTFKDVIFISSLIENINLFNRLICDYFGEVRYLEPLRASAQRYYRTQDLNVDELDSKGSNIAMFLQDNQNNNDLKQIIKKHFNVEFTTDSTKGHITVNITGSSDNKKINLADQGVGYSQILPILLQLWSVVYHEKSSSTGCLVVEQPELHLHPAYQAKIADITADVIKTIKMKDKNYNFVFETHSPHLINRLGELVEEGKINKDDVQILLFDNNDNKISF